MSDQFTRHEALHMAHVINELFENTVMDNSFVAGDPELKKAADEINIRLGQLYQLLGSKIDFINVG